jgi:ABC-type xylose transport system permease subunit
MRKGALLAVLMLVVILVTSKSRGAVWYALTVFEVLVLLVLFVFLDLWVTRKVYKKVTGQDPPAA